MFSWSRAGEVKVSENSSRTVSKSGVRQEAERREVLLPPEAEIRAPSESRVVAICSPERDVVPLVSRVDNKVDVPAELNVSLGIPARMADWMEIVGVRWSGQSNSVSPFERVWDVISLSADFFLVPEVFFLSASE